MNFSPNAAVGRFLRHSLSAWAIFLLLPLISQSHAVASIVSYGMNLEFSGGTAPSASAPWVTVTIDDFNLTGMVELTISANGLTGNENVSGLYLNLDPGMDPTDLLFSAPTKSRAFDTPSISTGLNAFKADGDGRYDILLSFATGGPPDTFIDGDSIEYTVTGIGTMNALSFFYFSQPAGGHGPFTSAAHIQNTGGGGDSGWVTDGTNGSANIPEPTSAILLLIGAVGLLGFRFRRAKR